MFSPLFQLLLDLINNRVAFMDRDGREPRYTFFYLTIFLKKEIVILIVNTMQYYNTSIVSTYLPLN